MALHICEQIMQAVETTLSNLTTTGANVWRDYIYRMNTDTLPGIVIRQGPDEPVEDGINIQVQDHYLEFYVDIYTAIFSDTAPPTTQANLIRKEIHMALLADTTLGISEASGLDYVRTEEPEINAGEVPTCRIQTIWAINYRSTYTDPSQ